LNSTASKAASSATIYSIVCPLVKRPIFSALAIRSSSYSSQLRDTDQVPFDMLPRPGLQAPARHQIDGPAQQILEVVLEIEAAVEGGRAIEVQ
jgi:hypothetical protein